MDLNLTNTGYVMVSRALLMSVSQKHHIASGDEEAFLRVLLHVNYKNKVLKHNGAEVTCARGESVISYLGWAEIFGWTRGHTRLFFERCFADGLLEQVPGSCMSHIRVPHYDAWTGTPAPKQPVERKMEEEVKNFIARYSEVTHKPIEAKGRIRNLWKRLSVRERELAMERMEDYYFTLPNINFCKTAVRYLEDKVFDNLIN
ncbi:MULTISPECIES: hypothetical protein [Bacteroides]|uniref:hypothetical protein n=1 Tax=Bacteroides TaxID=816 RepID=UPI000E440EA2|nr:MULTISPECIES: hypothetical protein [Bacteroides]MBS7574634.1 hypothetical protein [Bacteroides propionicigenes]RGM23784.1 hypothetical protein DXC20_16975 [Bacteroides sp. OM08-17BH]